MSRNNSRIERALKDADNYPNDAGRQARVLALLNENKDHLKVISRFENFGQRVTFDEACVREYIKALVYTGRFDHTNLQRLLTQYVSHAQHMSASSSQSPAAHDQQQEFQRSMMPMMRLDQDGPIRVAISETNKSNFWKLIRSGMSILIIVAAVSLVAEGIAGNVQKGFGMNGRKVVPVEDMTTSFADVKGCDEVKEELKEIIDYLQDPSKFTRLGAKLPKGIMMAGAPGTGKTLLARAIAGEAKVPFIQASGSEFEEMFVGVGARRIRDLFTAARKHTPCIVFIDEVDAVGSKRNNKDNSAVRMTLNQLLTELDGFEQNEGLVVICATNFPESLDKALTRPGRLDKTITVPLPDLAGRKEILQMYADKVTMGDDVDVDVLARRCGGMSGACLLLVCVFFWAFPSCGVKSFLSRQPPEQL